MGHTSPTCVSFCSLNDQTYEAQVCWSWLLFEFAATRLMSSIGFSTNSFQNRGRYGAHVPNMLFLLFSELSQQATARAPTRATDEGHRQGRMARVTSKGRGQPEMGEGNGRGQLLHGQQAAVFGTQQGMRLWHSLCILSFCWAPLWLDEEFDPL